MLLTDIHEIGKVAPRELALNGYKTLDDLTRVKASTLLQIHGVGPKAIRILSEMLTEEGCSFLPEEEK